MKKVLKTAPAVFAIGENYQIAVPVTCETVMWVRVGNKNYYDNSNGILRSKTNIHRMTVPMSELDNAGQYTICYRVVIKRKPYFSKTKDIREEDFAFRPVPRERAVAYHISDAHNMVEEPVAAVKYFEKEVAQADFLILNGDVPEDSGEIKNFDNIYRIIESITGGNIPVIFSRGNHDTRGIYAENLADYTPCLNGNSFFTFKLGDIWGLIVDCGEDKNDDHEEYGNMVCCHDFRQRETEYIEGVIRNHTTEYSADGINKKLIISHVPFTAKHEEPFDIEEDLFAYWAKIIKENIKPNLMICGHTHQYSIDEVGGENDYLGQPCRVVVGSQVNRDKKEYAGSGFIFGKDCIEVIFNNANKILERHTFKY